LCLRNTLRRCPVRPSLDFTLPYSTLSAASEYYSAWGGGNYIITHGHAYGSVFLIERGDSCMSFAEAYGEN
jgi:hypothetical protein